MCVHMLMKGKVRFLLCMYLFLNVNLKCFFLFSLLKPGEEQSRKMSYISESSPIVLQRGKMEPLGDRNLHMTHFLLKYFITQH